MDHLINMPSRRFVITRTRSEKISFFWYVFNLFVCILFGFILLVWAILAHLAESGVFDRGEFSGVIKRADIFVYLPSVGTSFGDVSWNFLIAFANILEIILVIGLYGAICVHRQRSIIDDFPDKEPNASVCFIYVLRIVIVLCLTLGGLLFLVDSPIRSHMSSLMESAIPWVTEATDRNIMDVYQSTFQCCGRESRKDWIQIDNDRGIVRDWTPQSCCINISDCSLPSENFFTDVSTFAMLGTTTSPVANTPIPFGEYFNETFDRGCNEAIQSWLIIHGLLLLTFAFVLLLLHISWVIWRRNARLPSLFRGCCESYRRNRVQPICLKVNESSTDSNISLVFFENGVKNNSSETMNLSNVSSLENNHVISKMPELPSTSRVQLESRMLTPIDNPPPVMSTINEIKNSPKTWRGRAKISRSSRSLSLKDYFENGGINLRDEARPRPPTPAKMPPQFLKFHKDIVVTFRAPELDFPEPVPTTDTWVTPVQSDAPKVKRSINGDKLSIVSLESLEDW
ncbi:uncharacterized protein LOC144422088 [Styela clava]